jgi:hypothetical protein
MEALEHLALLQDPRYLVDLVAVSLVMVGSGLILVAFVRRGSALTRHVGQIVYMAFLLPIVLLLAVIIGISKDAVVGLLGVIVGYSFGIARPVTVLEPTGPRRPFDYAYPRPDGPEEATIAEPRLLDRPSAYDRSLADLAPLRADPPIDPPKRNIFAGRRPAAPLAGAEPDLAGASPAAGRNAKREPAEPTKEG